MNRPNLIALNPDELSQGLRHYQFVVSLDKCNGSYNILDDKRIDNNKVRIQEHFSTQGRALFGKN